VCRNKLATVGNIGLFVHSADTVATVMKMLNVQLMEKVKVKVSV